MLARLLLITIFGVFCCLSVHGQATYLDQVEKLQDTAAKATGGALGCGHGTVILVTSHGEIRVGVGLDPSHVFGQRIVISDLVALLKARADSNRTVEKNPMSGHVSALVFVILSTLSVSKDATVIPVIKELLNDKDEVIRGWSAISLIQLAESDENLRKQIEKLTFPTLAIQSAKARGVSIPTWISIES